MKTGAGQHGMTYLWALFLVFLLGLGLGKSLEVYSTLVQRDKEADLLYIGNQYRQALRQYYRDSPGPVRRYPARLEELLRDPRYLTPKRYLRQLTPDPVTGRPFEVIPSPEGGIGGVRSTSTTRPLKQDNFSGEDESFRGSARLADWTFLADRPRT